MDVHYLDSILGRVPHEARDWFESLPWKQRRYILSLCHLMCAAPPEVQAEFLDNYTADGLVSRKLEDRETEQRVTEHLKKSGLTQLDDFWGRGAPPKIVQPLGFSWSVRKSWKFRIETELSETTLRKYIRQFYIHSAQDTRRQPDLYLESALRLVFSTEERNNVFNYTLGFELLKMMFQMSWLQHERFYRLQHNQEEFISLYIKPIQYAHRINHIIVPKDEGIFFARRSYFVKQPEVSEKKLVEIVMATFTTEVVTNFGFSIIRHPNSIVFDYDFIFQQEQEVIFNS